MQANEITIIDIGVFLNLIYKEELPKYMPDTKVERTQDTVFVSLIFDILNLYCLDSEKGTIELIRIADTFKEMRKIMQEAIKNTSYVIPRKLENMPDWSILKERIDKEKLNDIIESLKILPKKDSYCHSEKKKKNIDIFA